jgi:predicted DNA-binding protein
MNTTKKVRKTISISTETEKALRFLSRRLNKSQSRIIEELVEEKIKKLQKEERLKAFEELIKMTENLKGTIGNKKVQDLKGEMKDEL